MIVKKYWKSIVFNNIIFVAIASIVYASIYTVGKDIVPHQDGIYGGLELIFPLSIVVLVLFFVYLIVVNKMTASRLIRNEKLKYNYWSYLLVFILLGAINWMEESALIIYPMMILLPIANYIVDLSLTKFWDKK